PSSRSPSASMTWKRSAAAATRGSSSRAERLLSPPGKSERKERNRSNIGTETWPGFTRQVEEMRHESRLKRFHRSRTGGNAAAAAALPHPLRHPDRRVDAAAGSLRTRFHPLPRLPKKEPKREGRALRPQRRQASAARRLQAC